MKPPLNYYGGKATLAERIAALLPDHLHYVEPYCGSLAVLLAKSPAQLETVNDLDGDLVTFWRVLRNRRADLEWVCELTPHARAEHAAAREPAGDELETARRVWVMLSQGRSARLGGATGWRYNADPRGGRSGSMPALLDTYRGRFPAAAGRLARVSLECRPALEVIDEYGRHDGNLLYVDPPYLGGTRSSNNYRHEMSQPQQHRDLAEALHACKAVVVLSGYPSDMYDLELYPDWHRYEMATQTTQGGQGKATVEVLWSNSPLAAQSDLFADLVEGTA